MRELVSMQIVKMLSKSLGVVARNEEGKDVVVFLLARNSEVPMEQTADFGTDQPNQEGVEIQVMADERDGPDPLDRKGVGTATLNLPRALSARSPVRVTFAISRDGRLEVSAVDLTGGGSIHVEFETEAVKRADEVAERSTALRLLSVS